MDKCRALIFDVDGVILDSESFKIATFKSLFTDFPDHLDEIDKYNQRERGVNRAIKFKFIYENILRLPYSNKTIEELSEQYSKKLQQNLLNVPLISGVSDFLSNTAVPKFLATSSEKVEVESVMMHHYILKYFTKIYTHPTSKIDAIKEVLSDLNLKKYEVVFFGDALADYQAAQATGVKFIARSDNPNLFPTEIKCIVSFKELE